MAGLVLFGTRKYIEPKQSNLKKNKKKVDDIKLFKWDINKNWKKKSLLVNSSAMK